MEEDIDKSVKEPPSATNQPKTLQKPLKMKILLLIASIIGTLHYFYVSQLFENDRNFSHLSELEREMSLRTEMGFYYSFYKTLVEEKQFVVGITKLIYNNLVEYPLEVNSFNRFNIHPEVILASIYRYVEPWLNGTRECYMVDRGPELDSVQSCNGLEEPIIFYLEGVWVLAGVTAAAIFIFGATLSDSILGGLSSIMLYLSIHPEATRVMWTPNERENFAQPLLLLQMCLLTVQLRQGFDKKASLGLQMSICILNCVCLLFWQFTQFIFLTQVAIFFIMDQIKVIDTKSLSLFLHGHFCGLHMAILLLQGNDMLKTSLYASHFLIVSFYSLFLSNFRLRVRSRVDFLVESWVVLIRVALVVASSFWLKNFISDFIGTEEDNHIWEILDSKFTNYKNFHTQLYTCSEVFDFMSWQCWRIFISKGVLPLAVSAGILSVFDWYKNGINAVKFIKTKKSKKEKKESDSIDSGDDSGIDNKTSKCYQKTDSNKEAKAGNTKNKMAEDLAGNDLDVIDNKIAKTKKFSKTKDVFLIFLKNTRVDAGVFYNMSQMVVFGCLATLVMRLKVLFVPHMCIIAAIIFNLKCFRHFQFLKRGEVFFFWIIILSAVTLNINVTVNKSLQHKGEFSDVKQEELLKWIDEHTDKASVFAASMPLASSIMLSTKRAIVNHPHYEHVQSRQRNYAVYKAYGKFSPNDLYKELYKLKVTYFVLETEYCYGRSSKGCSFTEIWDAEAPHTAHNRPLCDELLTGRHKHFYMLFENGPYVVFRVHDYGVNYMPRAFYT